MRASRLLLAPLLGFLFAALAAPYGSAQSQGLVVRDGTLGGGPLAVGPGLDPLGRPATYLIVPEMGEQHEGNLFHSFASFGIGAGEVATFTGPDPIGGAQSVSNVIARVTGGDLSQIDGTLRSTIAAADLWLLNPSGVVIGAGAKLEVPGSFHASTGDYVGFGTDGLERFQADPSRPSVLSTAAPVAFGFLNESGAASLDVDGATLAVPNGETFELVAARDVSLTGAELTAPGGHVSLEAQGAVELSDSLVDAGGETPGSVSIRAGRVVVEKGSHVLAENTGEAEDAGGSIAIAATESVLVDDSLLSVSTESAGDAGAIYVDAPQVTFQNGQGFVHDFRDPTDPRNYPRPTEMGASAETLGRGAGGTIQIDAGSLTIQQGASLSVDTRGRAATGFVGSGDAGTIWINADSMDLLDQSLLSASAFRSAGNAGAIEIRVGGKLTADGGPSASRIRSEGAMNYAAIATWNYFNNGDPQQAYMPGASGRIEIEAGSIELMNGGIILSECASCTSTADSRPEGAATLRIKANSLLVHGGESYLSASTYDDSEGGLIHLDLRDSLILNSGGHIKAHSLNGRGNAGTVEIQARTVTIESGGSILANTDGEGNGGTVTIRAESVRIGPGGSSFINVTSARPPNASADIVLGNAGAIDIIASDSIFLTHEGGDRFSLVGVLTQASGLSGLLSATVSGGAGGTIRLEAPVITVTDGAIVATTTVGGGAGGSIELRGNRILVANGGVVDTTSLLNPFTGRPGGDAGSVTLEASDQIEVVGRSEFGDVSRVSSGSIGSGEAGEVAVRAPRILIDEGLVATAAVAFANGSEGSAGGSVTIRAGQLVVANGGQVNASSFIAGPAGSIDVVGRESILVTGVGSAIESRTGGAGAGGDVTLTAPRIEINDGGAISAKSERGFAGALANYLASSSQGGLIRLPPVDALPTGNAGIVSLDASTDVRLDRGTISSNAEAADGGNVTIRANELLYLDRSVITASVAGGTGGNITIDPDFVILQNGSRIEAAAGGGAGGQIQITTGNFLASPGSVVTATAGNPELSGTVEIHSPDVNLAGTLTPLASSFLDAASLMRERCAARRSGERVGRFSVRGAGGIPAEPDGWLRAPMLLAATATIEGNAAEPALVASLPSAPLVYEGCP